MSSHHLHNHPNADESQHFQLHRKIRERAYSEVHRSTLTIGIPKNEKGRVTHFAVTLHHFWLLKPENEHVDERTSLSHAESAVMKATRWPHFLHEFLEALAGKDHHKSPEQMSDPDLVKEHVIHQIMDHVENLLEEHGVTLAAVAAWSHAKENISEGARQLVHDYAHRGIALKERSARYLMIEALKALQHEPAFSMAATVMRG